jgi:hypothetical protein
MDKFEIQNKIPEIQTIKKTAFCWIYPDYCLDFALHKF